jgi:hypothetical protein
MFQFKNTVTSSVVLIACSQRWRWTKCIWTLLWLPGYVWGRQSDAPKTSINKWWSNRESKNSMRTEVWKWAWCCGRITALSSKGINVLSYETVQVSNFSLLCLDCWGKTAPISLNMHEEEQQYPGAFCDVNKDAAQLMTATVSCASTCAPTFYANNTKMSHSNFNGSS